MNKQRIFALLGRRDEPTDGVEEYCAYLREALEPHGFALELMRIPWAEKGWRTALGELREQAAGWRGAWVLLQYTALAWSRRGIPFGGLRVLRATGPFSRTGVKTGVVFHDVQTYPGGRIVDRVRRRCQQNVMRRLFREAGRVVLTVPAEKIAWLPTNQSKAVFIPVGANLPHVEGNAPPERERQGERVVAVFGVTGGRAIVREAHDIAQAVNRATEKAGRVRLIVLGRNSLEAQEALRQRLDNSRVELETRGILPAAEVAQSLGQADALLYVRGHISSRRTTALAGIACGLPVVAYCGAETAAPITEAGVLLAKEGDALALGEELGRVLSDAGLRDNLRERSRAAHLKYFSWEAIAARYAVLLRGEH